MTAVDFSQFVDELAQISAEVILPFFRTQLCIQDKSVNGFFDPVTEADKAAETVMRHKIRRTFPEHGIIGEEFGDENANAEYVWVLDPIDGTKSFICGLPMWGTLIGLTRRGVPVHGLMHQPFTGERFSSDGEMTTYRGPAGERTLRTSNCTRLDHATISTTSPLLMTESELRQYTQVEKRVRVSRYGGDCYSYCMLAAGHLDLIIECGLKPHDVIALVPIIQGAGGVITTWQGRDASEGGQIIASATRDLHRAALEVLNQTPDYPSL
jgi:histidinol phosphatase-like enzyme (inositol monophosphatase family)